MEISKYVLASLVSLASLFILTKILGNRQMSQVSMFDYVSSVAIGSIAGEMAVLSTDTIIHPLVSMLVFAVISYIISYITCKSIKLRRFFEGRAILMYRDGTLYEKNMLKAKIDIDELLSACRINGYFNLEDIQMVFLEPNGRISILPKAENRPATPKDMKIQADPASPFANVIMDGKIMYQNLENTGQSIDWVYNQLKQQGVKEIKNIMLATYDANNVKLNLYKKYFKRMKKDIFE